jgi:hypothetical protein
MPAYRDSEWEVSLRVSVNSNRYSVPFARIGRAWKKAPEPASRLPAGRRVRVMLLLWLSTIWLKQGCSVAVPRGRSLFSGSASRRSTSCLTASANTAQKSKESGNL